MNLANLFKYLNNMSHEQNLSSTSGEPEFLLGSNSLKFQPQVTVSGRQHSVGASHAIRTHWTMNPFCLHGQGAGERMPELEFLNNLWELGTEYRKRVIVPARQAT